MKATLLVPAALTASCLMAGTARAQEFNPGKFEDYGFRTTVSNPVTSIKDQYRSGTCWCFATTSFLESEAIRIGKLAEPDYPDFSEMYTICQSYLERAVKYLRLNGRMTCGPGSISCDQLHVVAEHGIVPQSAMPGKTRLPELFEMDREIKEYLDGILSDKQKLSGDWMKGLEKILVRRLGRTPESFKLDGTEYTPSGYRDSLGIKAGDYLTLSSFTHHPFYTRFALEVPDNWRWDSVWNIPVDELEEIMFHALGNGYTVAWGSDISEPGYTADGLAVIPEKEISQELRQHMFDVQQTVDDHMMHIFGLAESKDGETYFMVKNSSGLDWGDPHRYWYASVPFFRAKTIYITVHKDAVPEHIKDKFLK